VCADAAFVDLAPDPVDDERAIAWDMWEMRVVPVDNDAPARGRNNANGAKIQKSLTLIIMKVATCYIDRSSNRNNHSLHALFNLHPLHLDILVARLC
jgi:hypothetical protein